MRAKVTNLSRGVAEIMDALEMVPTGQPMLWNIRLPSSLDGSLQDESSGDLLAGANGGGGREAGAAGKLVHGPTHWLEFLGIIHSRASGADHNRAA